MQVNNLALGDYFNKGSAFGPNWEKDFAPASVSFDVVWSAPVTRRLDFQDTTHLDRFGGAFVENQATVTWSGRNAYGFTFTANPGGFSTSFNAFAELAHVQNGIFFDAASIDRQANAAAQYADLQPPGLHQSVQGHFTSTLDSKGTGVIWTSNDTELFGMDSGVMHVGADGRATFTTTRHIVGGTREYQNASGQIVASGILDFTTGLAAGTYGGESNWIDGGGA
jgi:hypothetical protein